MKIFIIEDDPLFARKFKFEIEATRLHDVHLFETAERAIGQLSLKPNLIFVDHFLSGIDGTDVISIIREKLPNCIIVSVSSQTDIKVLEKSIRDGAYRYIVKNNDFKENLAKLFNDLDEQNQGESAIKKINKLIDFSKKRTKPLVYIVDDDEVFSFIINYKIKELENCIVETFIEGNKAINNAEKNQIC